MIKVMTQCRNIATVLAFSFAISPLLSQNCFAQDTFDSFRLPGTEPQNPAQSVLDLSQAHEPADAPEDLNVLTRGPLHEAFASTHQANPQPSTLVHKTPPALIDEVPPEYKPDGNNVQWISGYWAWDDAQSDFIWISGIWRDIPPKRRWIPGYWNAEGDGHRWVSGIWTEETQLDLGYLPEPPASIDQGPSTTAPGEEYFYVPGNWAYQNDNYRWYAGHWQPVVENWIWIPARYVWTPNGCVYQSGYWDYEFQNRGTCFAPVQFTQPVFLAHNYSYRPSFAINLNVNFLTHLFVRPRCGHYFYGDWYGANFNNFSYQPWVSYSSHLRSYDPLLTYYRCRRSSFDTRYNVVQHLTIQHNFYANNRDFRPRHTYKSQRRHANSIKQLHPVGSSRGHGKQYEDFIRNASYVRTYKDLRKHDLRRRSQTADARTRGIDQQRTKKHRKVAEEELRRTRRQVEQLAKAQRDRQRKEAQRARQRKELSTKQVARKPSNKMRMQNIPSIKQREQEQLRQARDKAQLAAADAKRRKRQVTQIHSNQPTKRNRSGERNKPPAVKTQGRSQPNRNTLQEQAKIARQQQERQQKDRDAARKRTQQQQARNQLEQIRRVQQDASRRKAQQDQARRIEQQKQKQQQLARDARRSGSRNTSGKMRMQNIPSIQQREQAARQAQLDRDRQAQQNRARASQQSQRDAALKIQRDNARRAQRAAANKAKQDQARRAQQAAANRAKQDQARRAQQQAQERSRQQAAQRARQQQAQRDSARRAQQQAQREAARRAQANQQKQQNRSTPPQQSRSSRLRNRSKSKK